MDAAVYLETAVDTGARIEDFTTIGQVIEAGELWQTNQRHPVIRTGEREPIPSHVRAAIWYRDFGRCDYCPQDDPTDGPLNLDHIVPWSAGGPDTTENLRLLCEWHNQRRSNFIDHARLKRPATWWCIDCFSRDHAWTYEEGHAWCPIHRSGRHMLGGNFHPNQRCRVTMAYERAASSGAPATWHERGPVVAHDVIAYCAHCRKPSLTDVPL